jgi:hypothetical protein
MLSFVLRCSRVPIRAGKVIRRAMRHHWGLSHHAAHLVQHIAISSILVCVVVPIVWGPVIRSVAPLGADTLAPPVEAGRAVAVPEPSSILLLAVDAAMMLLLLGHRSPVRTSG